MGEHEWVFQVANVVTIVAGVATPLALIGTVISVRRERRNARERGPTRTLLVRRVPPKVRPARATSEA